ncbi:hypothetical protein QYM36_018018 [Artemia franciscana]|uniref:Xylulose kinase n=1 Tax=Artemia franciscana TaxID=6661 RepID=A0AA88H9U5_ARTSF|nr:hypothetical protein QYM36_018018 [Artemia franciscana]
MSQNNALDTVIKLCRSVVSLNSRNSISMEGTENSNIGGLFLGFDFSTQQIKATLINDRLEIVAEFNCPYETVAPEYGTTGGVHLDVKGKKATSPVLMWIKTFDRLLDEMKSSAIDLGKVKGIGGCAQQHGSVYWKHGAEQRLLNLDAHQTLAEQMIDAFSIGNSPVWMDASTSLECREIEEFVGSPQNLQRLTGSRAFERFTASQIRRIYKEQPEGVANTEHISLVSSFAASLLIGRYAPTDYADATGTNLFNINENVWESSICEFCGKGVTKNLGALCRSRTLLGKIAKYYVDRYGFAKDCFITAFTGDTCASLVGIGMKDGDFAISLGTSDTTFVLSKNPVFAIDGHVLLSPVEEDGFILMLGFQNGSKVREQVRSELKCETWEDFSKLLSLAKKGNDGFLGLYYDTQEITPKILGRFRFDPDGKVISSYPSAAHEARALIEGQFLAKKYHLLKAGFLKEFSCGRLFVTGGGSKNADILQVISDIFQLPVYSNDSKNSASFGSALLALPNFQRRKNNAPPLDGISTKLGVKITVSPDKTADKVFLALFATAFAAPTEENKETDLRGSAACLPTFGYVFGAALGYSGVYGAYYFGYYGRPYGYSYGAGYRYW